MSAPKIRGSTASVVSFTFTCIFHFCSRKSNKSKLTLAVSLSLSFFILSFFFHYFLFRFSRLSFAFFFLSRISFFLSRPSFFSFAPFFLLRLSFFCAFLSFAPSLAALYVVRACNIA